MSDLVRKLPIQYTHPDGVDVNGEGGGGNGSNANSLAPVAYTGSYNDLIDKPINEGGGGNSIFEPINDSMTVSNHKLMVSLKRYINYNSYFILKVPSTIDDSLSNGIRLYYNTEAYFDSTNIRLFNDAGGQVTNYTNSFIRSYFTESTNLLCRLDDGILYIKRFLLSEFGYGFSLYNYIKRRDLDNFEESLMNNKVGELYYDGAWKYSLPSDFTYNQFCIVTISGTEHALEATDSLAYNQYPSFAYGHYARLYAANSYSPLLLSARNLNAKSFLIQKISLASAPFYKLFDLDYFNNPFGYCYLSTVEGSSALYVVMPYKKTIRNAGVTFILETYLDSDVLSTINTCKVVSSDGLYSNCQINLNGYTISYSTPLKKDCTYICSITISGDVTLTRH